MHIENTHMSLLESFQYCIFFPFDNKQSFSLDFKMCWCTYTIYSFFQSFPHSFMHLYKLKLFKEKHFYFLRIKEKDKILQNTGRITGLRYFIYKWGNKIPYIIHTIYFKSFKCVWKIARLCLLFKLSWIIKNKFW